MWDTGILAAGGTPALVSSYFKINKKPAEDLLKGGSLPVCFWFPVAAGRDGLGKGGVETDQPRVARC